MLLAQKIITQFRSVSDRNGIFLSIGLRETSTGFQDSFNICSPGIESAKDPVIVLERIEEEDGYAPL